MKDDTDKFLPAVQVKRRYGITDMSLWRWDRDLELDFPKPFYIGRFRYWRVAELEAWERSLPSGELLQRITLRRQLQKPFLDVPEPPLLSRHHPALLSLQDMESRLFGERQPMFPKASTCVPGGNVVSGLPTWNLA